MAFTDIHAFRNETEHNLEKLLELFPDKNWDKEEISAKFSYNVYVGGTNRHMTRHESLFYIRKHPEINWMYSSSLCLNKNLTWDFIQEMKRERNADWNYELLSGHPCITWKIVKENPDLSWNPSPLSCNPNITWDIVQENPDYPWDYDYLSENPNITWDIIKNNLDKNWNFFLLSRHPNITLKIIRENPVYNWNYPITAFSPHISADEKLGMSRLKPYWHMMPGVTIDHICKYNLIEDTTVGNYSSHSAITWEFIQENPGINWEPKYVSCNPNITWKIVRDNPDYPWQFAQLSGNMFSYDEEVCNRKYNARVKNRKNVVSILLNKVFYKDIVNSIIKFVGYN